MRPYFIRLLVYTAILAAASAIITYSIPYFRSFQTFTWVSLFFFSIVTAITFYIGYRSLEKNAHGFVASVNGMVLIKLLLCVVLIIGYLVAARPSNASFIIPFFTFYVLFTVFEIRQLLIVQRLRNQNKV